MLKRPFAPVRGLAIVTVFAPAYAGVAVTSITAPDIGTPPAPVSRPSTVSELPYPRVIRLLLVPFQPTLSFACAEALTPFAGPGTPGAGGFAILIWRSSTVAALPA